MALCCQRDQAAQAQAREHIKKLQATDPSTARASMGLAVLSTPSFISACEADVCDSLEDPADEDTGTFMMGRY